MSYVITQKDAPQKRTLPHGEYTHFVVRAVPMMTHVSLKPGDKTDTHKHLKEVQTYYILEGKGFIVIDGEKYPIQEGDAAVIPPERDHHMENPGSGPLRFLMQYLLEGDAAYPVYKK